MRTTQLALVLGLSTVALHGCGDKGNNNDTGTLCETCDCINHPPVDDRWPESGATDVYNRTRIYALVDDDTPFESSMKIVDEAGTEVPGTVAFDADDGLIQFSPTDALAPNTNYTATLLTNDCEGESYGFTTGSIGEQVADLNSLVGRTWRMSLGGGKPPEDRDGLQNVLDMVEEDLLITSTGLTGTTLSVLVASTLTGVATLADDVQLTKTCACRPSWWTWT